MNKEALRVLIQEEESMSAEEKLHKALARLQNGTPLRTKAKGKLTLNKINNEAGLGRSYIHKFKEFIDKEAAPAIKKFNNPTKDTESPETDSPPTEDMSELDRVKADLKKEIELKEGYLKERNEYLAINDKLEALNKSLMFRVYELQQELTDSIAEYEDYKK